MAETFIIPESVVEQVTSALNVAIAVTMMKEPSMHRQMLEAARAFDDAVNDQPESQP